MAKFTGGIETTATGPLTLSFDLSEQRAQDIFVMLLGKAAPITRERTVPDPIAADPAADPPVLADPNHTKVETYQDTRTLGECLRDRITAFIMAIDAEAIEYKRMKAAEAAAAAVTDQVEVEPAAE